MKRILLAAVAILAVALAVSVRYSAAQRSERLRLRANQNMLLQENREYKVRDSLNAVSVGVLTMTADELRRGFDRMSALARDMDVKLRRLESVSQTSFESRYNVTAGLRDTVVGAVTEPSGPLTPGHTITHEFPEGLRSAKALRFSDAHIELEGLILDSTFYGSVLTRDTLTQFVHRIPRRFLFIKWGTKELRQEIVSSNPHTRITYSRSIRISK